MSDQLSNELSNELSGNNIRVIILEDEPLYRDLLVKALSQYPGLDIVATFEDGESCLRDAVDVDPRVALLDIELPGNLNGIEVGLKLREHVPDLGIVLLSNHQDPAFLSSLRQGKIVGWSYLHKKNVSNVEALKRAIESVVAGLVVLDQQLVADARPKPNSALAELTPRQVEILQLIAQGYTNAAIADLLGVSVRTIESHINVLYETMQLDRASHYQPRVLAVLEYLAQSKFPKNG